jgi:DNA-binding XRE family transcriptional regulator
MGDVVAFRLRPGSSPAGLARPAEPRSGHREPLWRELVGQVLRSRRTDRGETQRDVAERAGISVQYLSEIERGRKEPSSEMLAAVGGALDLPLVDLTRAVGQRLIRTTGRPTGPVALAA